MHQYIYNVGKTSIGLHVCHFGTDQVQQTEKYLVRTDDYSYCITGSVVSDKGPQ